MRGRWGSAAAVAALVFMASGCAAVQQGKSPALPSPSPALSSAELPSPSPSNGAALAITGASFHAGEVGVAYAPVALSATGGAIPYTWSISSGALPGGLAMTSGATVSGGPTAAGTFRFRVQVADATGITASVPRSISIAPALRASLIPACTSACRVEVGCASVCGQFGTASGGTPPYAYTFVSGFVPNGTHVNGLALAGTFTAPAYYWQFTVSVSDALGATTAMAPKFYVFDHLAFSTVKANCNGGYNTACSVSLRYAGGTPGGSPKVKVAQVAAYCPPGYYPYCPPAPTGLPGGFNATVGTGLVTVSVPAACGGACGGGYTGEVTLVLTDQSLCAAGKYCTSGFAEVDIYIAGG